MSTVHRFETSLALSESQTDAAFWTDLYRAAFPKLATMTSIKQDGWAQRGGIDRILTLRDGTQLTVDEKLRPIDYGDLLLERWSDRDRKSPGWVQKDLTCDYIAYAFVETQRCLLLPFQLLRRAWHKEGRSWIDRASHGLGSEPWTQRSGRHDGAEGFKIVWADNRSYVTESIIVPTHVVLDAVRDAMIIHWSTPKAA